MKPFCKYEHFTWRVRHKLAKTVHTSEIEDCDFCVDTLDTFAVFAEHSSGHHAVREDRETEMQQGKSKRDRQT